MNAHQPGSEPIRIPEQIPNPAVRPHPQDPIPRQRPDRRKPAKVPEKGPCGCQYPLAVLSLTSV